MKSPRRVRAPSGASDMVWNDVRAATPLREIARGLGGLVGIAIHATVLAFWCAEAALTETTGSDGAARRSTPRPSSATIDGRLTKN